MPIDNSKINKYRAYGGVPKPRGDTYATKDRLVRFAKITRVDWEEHVCDIKFLDGIDDAFEVPVTSPYAGARSGMEMMPEVGATVAVAYFRQAPMQNRPIIIGYLPSNKIRKNFDPVQVYPTGDGQNTTVTTTGSTLFPGPGDSVRQKGKKLYPGELHMSTHHGADLSLDKAAVLLDSKSDEIRLNPMDNSLTINVVNSYTLTDAGEFRSGAISRTIERAYGDDGAPAENFTIAPTVVKNNPKLLIRTEEGKERYYVTVGGKFNIDDKFLQNAKDANPLVEQRSEIREIGSFLLTQNEHTVDLDASLIDLLQRGGSLDDPCATLPALPNERVEDPEAGSDFLRRNILVDTGYGTLVGNNPCDPDRYGVPLKAQVFRSWKADGELDLTSPIGASASNTALGKHETFPIVNQVTVRPNQEPDPTDTRYLTPAFWWKMPNEYAQTQMYISKEGVASIYLGNSYEIEDCPFSPQLENPLGSGRSLEMYASGSTKYVIDKNRREEESLIYDTIGQVRFHFGRDDAVPSLVRRSDSKIQNHLNFDELDPYGDSQDPTNPTAKGATNTGTEGEDRLRSRTGLVRPLLIPGDNPTFTGDSKTGAEFKSIIGTTDGGITLRVGRDQGDVKRKFHYNSTPSGEGDSIANPFSNSTIDVRNELRQVYGSGDAVYRYKPGAGLGDVRVEHIMPEANRSVRMADVLGAQTAGTGLPTGVVYNASALTTPSGHPYILTPESDDYSGHSLDAHFVSDIRLRVGRDHDSSGSPRNNLSFTIDTAGGILSRIGADLHDNHSVTGTYDGSIFLSIGRSTQSGKSASLAMEGGYKAFIGEDTSSETAVSVIRNYITNTGVSGNTIHSNDSSTPAFGDSNYRWGPGNSSSRIIHDMTAAAIATRVQDLHAVELSNPDVEGRSIEILTKNNAWIRLGEDSVDNKSLVIDTAGGVVARYGRELHDHHSLTATYDGAIFATVGTSLLSGKSVSISAEGALKLLLGQDLGDGASGIQRNWTTQDKLSNSPSADGYGDSNYRFTPGRDGVLVEHIMTEVGRATREPTGSSISSGGVHAPVLNNPDIEGHGAEIHSQGNIVVRIDHDVTDNKSITLDTAGGWNVRAGREKNDWHSLTATYDGAIFTTIGSSREQKKSVSTSTDGGVKWRVGADTGVVKRNYVTENKLDNDCVSSGFETGATGQGPYTFESTNAVAVPHLWPEIGRATRETPSGAQLASGIYPVLITNPEIEGRSIEAHFESNAIIRLGVDSTRDVPGDDKSLILDLQGGAYYHFGKDKYDAHSITATYDGGIFATIGASTSTGKSLSITGVGGAKFRFGADTGAVSRKWVVEDKLSSTCFIPGEGDSFYRFTTNRDGVRSDHVMSEAGRAVKVDHRTSNEYTNEDVEGRGGEFHFENCIVLRVDKDAENSKSLVQDFAGGIIMRVGMESSDNHSITATYDGAIYYTVGRSSLDGKSHSVNAEGGFKYYIGAGTAGVARSYVLDNQFANDCSNAGLGDANYRFHNMSASGLGGEGAPYVTLGNAIGDDGAEGESFEAMLASDAFVRLGASASQNNRSLTLDLAGGFVTRMGKENQSRSIVTDLDGGIQFMIRGPDSLGAAINASMVGNKRMRLTGDEVTGILGNRQENVDGNYTGTFSQAFTLVTGQSSVIDSRVNVQVGADVNVNLAAGASIQNSSPAIVLDGAVFFGSAGNSYAGLPPTPLPGTFGDTLPTELAPVIPPAVTPPSFITTPLFYTSNPANIHAGTLTVFSNTTLMSNAQILGNLAVVGGVAIAGDLVVLGNLVVAGSISSLTKCC